LYCYNTVFQLPGCLTLSMPAPHLVPLLQCRMICLVPVWCPVCRFCWGCVSMVDFHSLILLFRINIRKVCLINVYNKRAMMALDRSPDRLTASKQCLRQASWPSLMKIESQMWPLVCQKVFFIVGQCDLAFDRRQPIFKLDLEVIKTTFLADFQEI
jgi:hypothetical protein